MSEQVLMQEKFTHTPEMVDRCQEFVSSNTRPKFLFGRNRYAERVVEQVSIDGFIDDFCTDPEYLGKPIVRLDDVPANALVLVLAGGRPLTAMARVQDRGLECIDYFCFYKHAGLPLTDIHFLEGFEQDFPKNSNRYEWVYNLLSDDVSREQFQKLLNFKRSYVLECLEGFSYLEDKQYFEPFLGLKKTGEVFADIGCFDGFTSEEFIKHCPDYAKVHVFEPIPENMIAVKARLSKYSHIEYHPVGLSDRLNTLRFSAGGSSSRVSDDGEITVNVDRLDHVVQEKITLLKMDIEGGELDALAGAEEQIRKYRPRLAVSVYHRPSDMWKIPEFVLSIYPGYRVYLRHYTESIYETVMFFIPEEDQNA